LRLLDSLSKKAFLATKDELNRHHESIYDIEIKQLDGTPLELAEYKDKFLLFVNVASKCGFTPQYKDLEKLFQKYKEQLMIIGVPCNQFGSQEPGSEVEIQNFCALNYGVSFTMTEKIDVKGARQHKLYQWLTQQKRNGKSNSTVRWNFQKYLIGPSGNLIDYYYSTTSPLSKKITKNLISS
jgi:glutathione peroxidase